MTKIVNRVFTCSALSLILVTIPMSSFAQDPCAGALIQNHFNGSYSSVEFLASVRLKYGSSSDSSDTNAGATIPFEGIPANFNVGYARTAASNYFDQSSLTWGNTRLESVATQTLSEAAVEAYKACRKSLPSSGPRVLVYDATETGATVSVTWFSGPGAPTKTTGKVTLNGGSFNDPFPSNWKTGQKVTRSINRAKLQDLRVIANVGDLSDDQFVSQLPRPSGQPVGIAIGSCIGKGGVEGVRLWGPTSEYCNGISEWGFYDARVRRVTQIGSCLGHGGEEGVRLYGPLGEDCGGIYTWGKYTNAIDIATIGLSSCKGHGNILGGHDLWGPTGSLCGGMIDPQWGKYQVGTKNN
ncbi:hypothetical protein PS893_00057 [Pseudomonas fluorescens]|uniref:hypothetical protein n=1 Tax=Pseudomonas fluorescens TaxID=294 RepID=UPI00125AB2A5|nr:hypothetical protein [Pseudomonas fluorescens]VVO46606.1 hypothetical protein PS893_00057 [Pseudomonas fluorescens]